MRPLLDCPPQGVSWAASQVGWLQACMSSNAREHLRSNLVTIVEREHVVGPAGAN